MEKASAACFVGREKPCGRMTLYVCLPFGNFICGLAWAEEVGDAILFSSGVTGVEFCLGASCCAGSVITGSANIAESSTSGGGGN